VADFLAREPQRHAEVHVPFVRTNADAGIETYVLIRIIGVEVVRLAPGAVAFDRMLKIVLGSEDGHTAGLLLAWLQFAVKERRLSPGQGEDAIGGVVGIASALHPDPTLRQLDVARRRPPMRCVSG
jgi:hypothetical protein